MKSQLILGLGLALLSACNGALSKRPASLDEQIAEDLLHGNPVETLPAPYTAAELQAASPAGTTFVSRANGPRMSGAISTLVFEESTPEGALMSSTLHDSNGDLLKESGQQPWLTWEQIRDQAAYPAHITTMERKSYTGALGTHMCKVYTIRSPFEPDITNVFWFAEGLPGPAIFIASYKSDRLMVSSELIERR